MTYMVNDVLTVSEAARKWGLNESTIRAAIRVKKFILNIDYRKSGGTLLITKKAMEKVYGKLPDDADNILICEICNKEIKNDELISKFIEGGNSHIIHALSDTHRCEYEYMRGKLLPSYLQKSELENS